MDIGNIIVDVGKTAAKATLLDPRGRFVARRERANAAVASEGVAVLDAAGIEEWLGETLRALGEIMPVRCIVPVGHGAAAAILKEGALAALPLDYEQPLPAALRRDYDAQRDPFALTGSPALPDGLNLGAQLHLLEARDPSLLAGGSMILPWAQYWAWLLSGVAASEVSSLGCHTDLWRPGEAAPSELAQRRGWAARLAPLRRADEVLGPIRPEWAERTGLARDTAILCGVHDSNAAMVAARGFAEIRANEATVLSTGTWFVAMRSPALQSAPDPALLDERRDCLVNVDVGGRAIPSARFMGGREIQLLLEEDELQIDRGDLQAALLGAVREVIAERAMILPTMAPGVGPFGASEGRWVRRPASPLARAAAVALYAALVADASLDLIGACERLLVEGRFSRARVFVDALAALRPATRVFVAEGDLDLAYGGARLIDEALPAPCGLREARGLDADLASYRAQWRDLVEQKAAS